MHFLYSAFADESSNALADQIDALKRNDFQYLEIRNIDEKNVSDLTLQEAKDKNAALKDNGLAVWSIGSRIGKIKIDDDFQAHLDLYKHTLDLAGEFGANRIRLFSFYLPKEEDPAVYKELVLERMAIFANLAKSYGILACHENEKGIYGDIASRCLDIHKAVPELGGVFDPANFVQCNQDTLEAWDMLKDYIDYMHIKDSLTDGRVVPPGDGAGNVAQLLRFFAAQGGKVLSLEPHLTNFVGLASLEDSASKSAVGNLSFDSNEAAFDFAANSLKKLTEE